MSIIMNYEIKIKFILNRIIILKIVIKFMNFLLYN